MPADANEVEILLVDDDEREITEIATAVASALGGRRPVHLRVIRRGDEAPAYLHPQPDAVADGDAASDRARPRLILIGADHPSCHGFDVLDDVQTDRQLRAIPVVVLTGADHGELPSYYAGRCTVLPRPFSPTRLDRILGECAEAR
jgi:CheY-like chemotaxis protein